MRIDNALVNMQSDTHLRKSNFFSLPLSTIYSKRESKQSCQLISAIRRYRESLPKCSREGKTLFRRKFPLAITTSSFPTATTTASSSTNNNNNIIDLNKLINKNRINYFSLQNKNKIKKLSYVSFFLCEKIYKFQFIATRRPN